MVGSYLMLLSSQNLEVTDYSGEAGSPV